MATSEPRGRPASLTSLKADLSLQHLVAELARIDVRIRRQVRRWTLAGQDPADAFRGLYISDGEAESLLARPFGTGWGQGVRLDPEEEAAFAEAEAQAADEARGLAEAAQREGHALRLECLARAFDLDPFERDVLLICLAPALDLRYERLFGYLQDDVTRKHPSVNLVLDLLAEPGLNRLASLSRFTDSAPLFMYHLLERLETGASLLGQTLVPDGAVAAWLLGGYQPGDELGSHAALEDVAQREADLLLVGDAWEHLMAAAGRDPVIALWGPDRASQAAAARLLAAQVGRPLLSVGLVAIAESEGRPLQAVRRALRDARVVGAVPFLDGWDACLVEGAVTAEALAALCDHPGLVVVGGRGPWQPAGVERQRELVRLVFPIPPYPQRRVLWAHFLGGDSPGSHDLDALAGQFLLTAGQIRDAVASARDIAAHHGGPLTGEDLFGAARAHSSARLSSLARKIEPRHGWKDIVLPEDQIQLLREIIATVRGRPQVLEGWGVGHKLASSSGVTALFSGPPGTGKTMAAGIIAGELGLDLYKIDLSTVVSKYIGETEKNLERIFDTAASSNAILFFDEADALFGKRSEVRDSHDRYANIEISYLLQRMEAYDGVTILATNLRANLDEAFTRRLQFAVDFPFPEEADRLRIWQILLPPEVPCAPDLDLALLARRFKLAGGNIRNILVSAAFLAASDGGQVTMAHLLHGTRRELQKMGRLVDGEDLTPEQTQLARDG